MIGVVFDRNSAGRSVLARHAIQRSRPPTRSSSIVRISTKSPTAYRFHNSCAGSRRHEQSKAQIKAVADRAEARSRGAIDDDDAEWERGFGETCDKASRERSREIIEAEIARLALLTPLEYEIERREAAARLGLRPSALDASVKAKRPKTAVKKSAASEINPDELQRVAGHITKHPDILSLFAKEFSKVIAGEAVNGKLLYLVATSRLFDKTMNAAIKGTSAGGKSEIRKRVLEFFPSESVVTFTSLSEKSLIFL